MSTFYNVKRRPYLRTWQNFWCIFCPSELYLSFTKTWQKFDVFISHLVIFEWYRMFGLEDIVTEAVRNTSKYVLQKIINDIMKILPQSRPTRLSGITWEEIYIPACLRRREFLENISGYQDAFLQAPPSLDTLWDTKIPSSKVFPLWGHFLWSLFSRERMFRFGPVTWAYDILKFSSPSQQQPAGISVKDRCLMENW